MTVLHAEILAIGTELLLGEGVDTNSTFLAGALRDLGIFLHRKTVVGDNQKRLEECISQSLERCGLVILTGGLGPTDDDMTREAVSAVLGETPAENPALLAALEAVFRKRNRRMSPTNRKQAWLIPSATPLENPVGTACGWFARKNGKIVVALPGPPHEMKKMWLEQVVPLLPASGSRLHHVTFHTHGVGESNVAELLGELTLHENPSIATYARRFGVDVRVAASAPDLEAARKLNAPFEARVAEILGTSVYGRDEETLSSAIGDLLVRSKRTLGILESLTGGLIADTITETPGASRYLKGCLVPYQESVKEDFGIPGPMIAKYGVVSGEVARTMAEKAREVFRSDWGLGVTGVAGPAPVGENRPGVAFIGICGGGKTFVEKTDWPGERRQVKERTVNIALMFLFKALRGDPLE